MADIKQAAQWLEKGHRVTRSCWTTDPRDDLFHQPLEMIDKDKDRRICSHGVRSSQWNEPNLTVNDVLADDWEIVEG